MPKTYIHARLGTGERAVLEALNRKTGRTESEFVRRGLQLVAAEERNGPSARALAGLSVGRFRKGPRTLSVARKHLEGFGA